MAIHHSQRGQAERMGFTLEDRGALVVAFHAATAVQVFGVSGKDAINQMTQFLNIHAKDPDIRFQIEHNEPRIGWLRKTGTDERTVDVGTPTELFRLWGNKELQWSTQDKIDEAVKRGLEAVQPFLDAEPVADIGDTFTEDQHPKDPPVDPTPVIARNAAGIPLDGAIAYKEGITAGDCPFNNESEDEAEAERAEKWYADWDEAADAAQAEEDENPKGGTVVAPKYRTKYAEMGHPTHCGDWLAELLNNYCIGDKNTDLEVFERICGLNGVDTSKYKREGIGWQGRIRMTGRNLLAKRVFAAGHIIVPNLGDTENSGSDSHKVEAPADWMAAQRYTKPKAA